jgi:hypothetical protein
MSEELPTICILRYPVQQGWIRQKTPIKRVIAIGPTPKWREVPNKAYTIKGMVEAYKPATGR